MKWKDVLIGALASLMVTILGGVAVYYFTKEPEEKKVERLVYSVRQSASFNNGTQQVVFSTIRVGNEGGVGSKNVSIRVVFKNAVIKDFAIDVPNGIREVKREVKNGSVDLLYENLFPGEFVVINALVSSQENPEVLVRSDASFATVEPDALQGSVKESRVTRFLNRSVPLTGLLLLLLLAVFYRTLKRGGGVLVKSEDRNNAAFLLLHSGFVEEAENILREAVQVGRCDAFVFSNLSACRALMGDFEEARRFLEAANFFEPNGHAKAVCLFNEGVVNMAAGESEKALLSVVSAFKKSPSEIAKYCRYSVHFEPVRGCDEIKSIVDKK